MSFDQFATFSITASAVVGFLYFFLDGYAAKRREDGAH
jgi:hypothetical protein